MQQVIQAGMFPIPQPAGVYEGVWGCVLCLQVALRGGRPRTALAPSCIPTSMLQGEALAERRRISRETSRRYRMRQKIAKMMAQGGPSQMTLSQEQMEVMKDLRMTQGHGEGGQDATAQWRTSGCYRSMVRAGRKSLGTWWTFEMRWIQCLKVPDMRGSGKKLFCWLDAAWNASG